MNAKRTNGRWLALASTLALGLGGRATAQDGEKPGTEHQEQVTWLETTEGARELLAAIAAVRVAMDVEGDLEAAASQLVELSLKASSLKGFEGQAEVLVQAALARSELQRRLGDLAKAVDELQRVLPAQPFRIRTAEKVQQGPPSPGLLAALDAARSDARIRETLTRLGRAVDGAVQSSTGSLDELVDSLFDEQDYTEIVAIGFAAFERFAARILETATVFRSDPGDDPLLSLLELDERRSARFLAANLAAGGPLWRQRVLRVMTTRQVLENDGTWTRSEPFVCLEPEWLELVEQLLAERETAGAALSFYADIERRDALTASLNAAFVRALGTFGPDFATLAMQAFDHVGVVPSAQPALEAALALPDARLRSFAAQKLVHFARSEALLACARDANVEVRRSVVEALGSRSLQGYVFQRNVPSQRKLDARVDERDAATLRLLLADEDAGIREAAVALLDSLERPLADEEYARLCADPAPNVRARLTGITKLAPEARGRMLALLARDPAQQVVQSLDSVLENDFGYSGPISTNPEPYLEALEARWKDAERPLGANLRAFIQRGLLDSVVGTRALVAWMLSTAHPEALRQLDGRSDHSNLLALPDEILARLLASSDDPEAFETLWDDLRTGAHARPAAMRLLMVDERAPRRSRLAAARLGAEDSPAYRQALLALLRAPSWKTRPPDQDELQQLRYAGAALAPDRRNALALEVLKDAAIAEEVADPFVSSYRPEAEGGLALAEAILARWLRPGAPAREAVSGTLYRLGQIPGLARAERLEPVLERYPEEIVEGIGQLADPQFLPLLARAMRAEWLPYDKRDDLQRAVARALGGFDDDQAVALLLSGLRSNDADVREACFESLERIKTYRAHVAVWRSQTRALPTPASALGELLALLGDPDPLLRKEAARGLGALGATEALPDLIRALKDADAGVRAAAQAAIERLSAPVDPRATEAQPDGG